MSSSILEVEKVAIKPVDTLPVTVPITHGTKLGVPLEAEPEPQAPAAKKEAAIASASLDGAKTDSAVQEDTQWSIQTSSEKKLIILAASIAAFFSPVASAIYLPALNIIAADLHVTNSLVNLSITTYLIMQGLAPAFTGSLSDSVGRRPVYMVCFIIYIAVNVALALQNSYAGLLVLRTLQSAGSSGLTTLANAIVADIVTPSERGIYVAYTSVAPQAGPALGPVIGGLLVQYIDWHSIFWFLAISAVVVAIPMALFFPETCRKIVGDGSIPPKRWNRCFTNSIREKSALRAHNNVRSEKGDEVTMKPHLRFPNPFGTLKILLRKECGLPLLFSALLTSGTYAVMTLIPSQFGSIYDLNELQISLCYLPLGAGSFLAAFVRGPMIDYRFKYHAKKLGMPIVLNRRIDMSDFPIERARLEVALPTLFLGQVCAIAFGWTVDCKTNLAGPLILLFVAGFCSSATLNCITVLNIDLNPYRAGTAAAANLMLRCWVSAGATALVVPLINAIGVGGTCTVFAGAVLALSPILWYIMKQGPRWRREGKEKAERKKAEKERKTDIGGERGWVGSAVKQ